jgi:hypothetical protein
MDNPGPYTGETILTTRSIATIFGSNLAGSAVSSTPPWQKSLGGVEVHTVLDGYTSCGEPIPPTGLSCEIVTDLLYVGPTQINFIVPDIPISSLNTWPVTGSYSQNQVAVRVVLIRDGVRYDSFGCNSQSCIDNERTSRLGPGVFYIGKAGDLALFVAGYDCLFSQSLAHPETCGYSLSSGQYRVPIGAVTDSAGNLITSQNPMHQDELVTLWMTGLGGLSTSSTTGLIQQVPPAVIYFGMSQYGVFDTPRWASQTPIWAGESPQFVGLDQINIRFPVPACARQTKALVDERYDAYMGFRVPGVLYSGTFKVYIPFLLRAGDQECLP